MNTETIVQYGARIVPVIIAAALFYYGGLWSVGRWQPLRRLLPYLDDEARDRGFYTSYEITDEEYVGDLFVSSVDDVKYTLEDVGYIESPLAAHKTYRGHEEVASMSYYGVHGEKIRGMNKLRRFLFMITRYKKVHVTVFDAEGYFVVTAHREFVEYNPLYALAHLRGRGMNIDKGVLQATKHLIDVDEFRPGERAYMIYEGSAGR